MTSIALPPDHPERMARARVALVALASGVDAIPPDWRKDREELVI